MSEAPRSVAPKVIVLRAQTELWEPPLFRDPREHSWLVVSSWRAGSKVRGPPPKKYAFLSVTRKHPPDVTVTDPITLFGKYADRH